MPILHLAIPIFLGIFKVIRVPTCVLNLKGLPVETKEYLADAWYVQMELNDFKVTLFSHYGSGAGVQEVVELNRDLSANYNWKNPPKKLSCVNYKSRSYYIMANETYFDNKTDIVLTMSGIINTKTKCFVNSYIKAPQSGDFSFETSYPGNGKLSAHWWTTLDRRSKRSLSFCPSIGIDIGISFGVAICNAGDISEEVSNLIEDKYEKVDQKIDEINSNYSESVLKQTKLLNLQRARMDHLEETVKLSAKAAKEFEKNFDKFLTNVHDAWEVQSNINDHLTASIDGLVWRTVRTETMNSIRILKSEWLIKAQTQLGSDCAIKLNEYNVGHYPLILMRKIISNHVQVNDLINANRLWLKTSHHMTEELVNVSKSTLRIENGSLELFNQSHNDTYAILKELNTVIKDDANYVINSLKYRSVDSYLGIPLILKGVISIIISFLVMRYPSYMPVMVSVLLSFVGFDYLIRGIYSLIKSFWIWL